MITIDLPEAQIGSDNAAGRYADTSTLDVTDEELMEGIQNRDERALAALHDRYASTIKALIMRVLHNNAESDDMLQEVFVELWSRAGNYDVKKGRPLGWLVTLTRRRAIDRLRSREAYGRMEERLLISHQTHPRQSHSHVQEDAVHSEMREHLARAMALLPVAQKQVIDLAYFGGLSQRDIAAQTGIPLGTVKTRLELAMKKIALALKGMEDLL